MQIGVATKENSMETPQKIKTETALCLRDSTSGYISEETKNTNSKEYRHPILIEALFTTTLYGNNPSAHQ